ncbi:MAG TPA: FUN14 domain-containing protein [Deinococcales bacterium]|nr:FUN14 domain-containing protein [Deinococcales bacterium]
MTGLPDFITPYLGQLSFGLIAGFAVGYALKKIGRLAALVLGLIFITTQLLAHFGLVQVDWLRIQQAADPLLNRDNLTQLWNGLISLLTNNVPFAAAFVPGLLLGLRFG